MSAFVRTGFRTNVRVGQMSVSDKCPCRTNVRVGQMSGYRLKILLCKVISVVHCNDISVDYYGIEFVKLKSKRASAKQATDRNPGLFNITYFNSTFGVLRLPVYY